MGGKRTCGNAASHSQLGDEADVQTRTSPSLSESVRKGGEWSFVSQIWTFGLLERMYGSVDRALASRRNLEEIWGVLSTSGPDGRTPSEARSVFTLAHDCKNSQDAETMAGAVAPAVPVLRRRPAHLGTAAANLPDKGAAPAVEPTGRKICTDGT